MSDPLDQLARFDGGDPQPPLPAAEVRRLGDRRRRRQTLLAGVGAAVAVAVIATPIALLGPGDDPDSSPEPAPAPPTPSRTTHELAGQVLTTLPDDFDLTVGMPGNDSGEPVEAGRKAPGLEPAGFCGFDVWADDETLDRLAVSASGPEYGEVRELRLYPDLASASDAVQRFGDMADLCPTEVVGGTTWTTEVAASPFGPAAIDATRTYGDGAGGTLWQLVRIGNAVLATEASAEYGADLTAPLAEHTQAITPVVDQLCGLLGEACTDPRIEDYGRPARSSPDPADQALADDVPLAAGWPADGGDYSLEGPGTDVAAPTYEACDVRLHTPGVTALQRAALSGPEDYRGRELLVFSDADGAIAYVDSVRSLFQTCPEEPTDGGTTRSTEVRDLTLGGQSLAVVRSFVGPDDTPAIGLEALLVVRLGRSVVVDTVSNEGTGTDPRIRDQVEEQSSALDDVVGSLCTFTEAGC